MKYHTLSEREESRRLSLIRDAQRRIKAMAAQAAWEESETVEYSAPVLRILPDADEAPDPVEE